VIRLRSSSWIATGLVGLSLMLFAAPASAVIVRTAVRFRPVARAAVVVGAAAVTAVAIGSVVRTLPPSCSTMNVGNAIYQQCGSTWYQPQYAGTQVTYVVVNPPM
jgi:hypothetical protein